MKKVFVDGYFNNNLGDDLFLRVLAERFPKVEFIMLSDKKYADIYHQISGLKIINKGLLIKIINKYISVIRSRMLTKLLVHSVDVYLEIGGSIFQQANINDRVTIKRRNILKTGIPYFIIGSNFGPVITNEYINEYKKFFSHIENITVRDSASYRLFDDLDNIQFAPDVVFGLDTKNIKKFNSEQPYIVITAIDLTYGNRLLGKKYSANGEQYRYNLLELCKCIINSGYNIKLVPFSAFEQDSNIAAQIKMGIPDENKSKVKIIEYTNISNILSLLKGAEGIVSGRYHSMILGWIFGIPQFVITYSDKMENTITDIFPGQKKLSIKEFSEKSGFEEFTIDDYMNVIKKDSLKINIQKSKLHFEELGKYLNQK